MTARRHRTVQAVAGTIRRHELIRPGDHVLVATSGGRDSVALAGILRELAAGRRRGFRLTLAHLNHRLRPTADRDEQFVRRLADRWGAPLEVDRADVPRRARRDGVGLEEAARNARYDFLERAARRVGARRIALGHHADDQAETVLMNFLRGSGVRGLAGMPMRRPVAPGSPVTVVRPLLEVERAALERYLRTRGFKWVEDPTNRSGEMTRNRIRHDLLPLLERDWAPGLGRRLVRMAEQFAAVERMLAGRAAVLWEEATIAAGDRAVEFDLARLRAAGRALTAELLLAAFERLGAGRGAITAEHLAEAWAVVERRAGGQTLELPGGLRLERHKGRIRLTVGEQAE